MLSEPGCNGRWRDVPGGERGGARAGTGAVTSPLGLWAAGLLRGSIRFARRSSRGSGSGCCVEMVGSSGRGFGLLLVPSEGVGRRSGAIASPQLCYRWTSRDTDGRIYEAQRQGTSDRCKGCLEEGKLGVYIDTALPWVNASSRRWLVVCCFGRRYISAGYHIRPLFQFSIGGKQRTLRGKETGHSYGKKLSTASHVYSSESMVLPSDKAGNAR